jgi:carbon storage regulator CsrA
MLVLSRKKNESLVIDNDITVTVVEIREDQVRLGIVVPKDVSVHRQEVFDAVHWKPHGGSPSMGVEKPAPKPQGSFVEASMYERFTDKVREVMRLANEEARQFNHEYVGTEHVLLGVVKEGSRIAGKVLKALDIDLPKIRSEVEKIIMAGPGPVAAGRLPLTPRAKKVLEFAREEAHNLAHNDVGTEHLLLGLLREEEGVAAQVLVNLGLSLVVVRRKLLEVLGHFVDPSRPAAEIEYWAGIGATPALMEAPDVPEAVQSILNEYDRQIARLQIDKEAALVVDDSLSVTYLRNQIRKLTQSREIMMILFRGL